MRAIVLNSGPKRSHLVKLSVINVASLTHILKSCDWFGAMFPTNSGTSYDEKVLEERANLTIRGLPVFIQEVVDCLAIVRKRRL